MKQEKEEDLQTREKWGESLKHKEMVDENLVSQKKDYNLEEEQDVHQKMEEEEVCSENHQHPENLRTVVCFEIHEQIFQEIEKIHQVDQADFEIEVLEFYSCQDLD